MAASTAASLGPPVRFSISFTSCNDRARAPPPSAVRCSAQSDIGAPPLLRAAKYTVDRYIKSGMVIGLGSGNASSMAINYLGQQLRAGALEDIVGVPTRRSVTSASEGAKSGIPLDNYRGYSEKKTLIAVIGCRKLEGRESIIQEKFVLNAAKRPVFIITENNYKGALDGSVPVLVQSLNWTETAEEIDVLFLGDAEIVGEAECRKAYDSAVKFYMSIFDRSKPLEEAAMTEAHEEAVQKSLAAFNESAVDGGSARKKYGELLHRYFRRNFEEYEMNAFGEADMKCSHTIRILKKKLRTACHEPNAGIDNVLKVLGGLCSEYEAASHGQSKWQKLAVFFWEGPIEDLGKRLIDQVGCQRSSCMLKCQAIEDQVGLLKKELEASENYKTQYLKQYKDAIRDKTLSDDYSSLQGTCGSLEERSSSLLKTLESAKQESLDWNRKYEQVLSKQKAEEDQTSSEIAILKSQSSAAEARVAAGEEQAQSNLEEAEEWKRKYDIAFREAKAALEKAAIAQERTDKDTPEMEDGLRVEFIEVATKEDELKEKAAQFEYAEQCLTSIKSELKAAESKIEKYDVETMTLKKEIKALSEKLETTNGKVQIWEMESLRLKEILRDGLQLPIMKDLAARGVWPVSTSVNGA